MLHMKKDNLYKSWRDKLLLYISEEVCRPCTDERKKQYTLNFDNPLLCGCRCNRVEGILENSKVIDEDIKKLQKKIKNSLNHY
ncbi:MAG: hypothetical protein DIZ80_09405 [endosymbiont of Galathealinum brachiosum]|uniref:Uncharacterized protein n=1 Tax=endosymbiont of Galathealinum brachiosum TaxID=2200906 RepID=A0A370DC88_9GAMM|nr:MAG: hypothetical protein DIZ80_09405 [endosymbiont of Galathealinum brachiosum]